MVVSNFECFAIVHFLRCGMRKTGCLIFQASIVPGYWQFSVIFRCSLLSQLQSSYIWYVSIMCIGRAASSSFSNRAH